MATVYRATHVKLGRVAALKMLRSDLDANSEPHKRMMREAQLANRIKSPHIVDIWDVIELEEPQRTALVMELIDGPTLAEYLASGPLDVASACRIMVQLIDVVAALHAEEIVHRDLKPANIMMVGLRDAPAIKLLDFGIGKVLNNEEQLTKTGMMLGTPTYMAPEQIVGLKLGPAADVFALGALLYEMISGRPAYAGRKLDILRKKIRAQLPTLPLPDEMPDAEAIRALIVQCLSLDPDERPSLERLRARLLFLSARAAFVPQPSPVLALPTPDETVVWGPKTIVDAQPFTIELPFPETTSSGASRRRFAIPCLGVILAGGVFGAIAQLGLGVFT